MKEEIERTPLKIVIQNFLNHIENLQSQKIEDSYEKEFQELKYFSEILKTSKQYSCSEGEKEVNRKKNRYKDILPFDSSRVILGEYAGIPGSDYINANYIKGASGSPAYIASQGPLPHTVNDFWRMIVECEVQVIVMACNQEEAGKHKCENYWVEREGEEKQFGMVAIRLIKASIVCPDFLVRTMKLKYINSQTVKPEERTICQFHYSAWPDHGVPPLVRPLLDMVRLVRDTQASETLPVLVHCSAGCGRTGTICAIDYVWGLLRAGKLTKDFNLYKLVREMRTQRIAMVQTKEQYVLVHQAVRELFNEQLRMIDAHPYENIDSNGMPLVEPIEPAYVTLKEKIITEEKQDNKEKEGKLITSSEPPPLPRKRRTKLPASKQEKEVENLTEKRRLTGEHCSDSDTGSNSSGLSGTRPQRRINRLKALFERSPRDGGSKHRQRSSENFDEHRSSSRSQQVARSHSLGALRYSQLEAEVPKEENNTQLLIKRSKSLKVLGSSDRYKMIENIRIQNNEENVLSKNPINTSASTHLINNPSNDPTFYMLYNEVKFQGDPRRRRSLESVNLEEIELKPNTLKEKIPPGLNAAARNLLNKCTSALEPLEAQQRLQNLGVRERSNSFRQAIGKSSKEYEAIWLISNSQNKTPQKGNPISHTKYFSTVSKDTHPTQKVLVKEPIYNSPNRTLQSLISIPNSSNTSQQVKISPQISFPPTSDNEPRQSPQNQHMKINVHSSKPSRLNATLSPCRTYVDIYPSPNESSSSDISCKQESTKTKDEPNLVEIKSMKDLKVGFHKKRTESMKFNQPINRSEDWKKNTNMNSPLTSYKPNKSRSEPLKEAKPPENYSTSDSGGVLNDPIKQAQKTSNKIYSPPIYSGKTNLSARKNNTNEATNFYLSITEKEGPETNNPLNFPIQKPIYVKNDENGEYRTEQPHHSNDPTIYPYLYDMRFRNQSMSENPRSDHLKSHKNQKSYKLNPQLEETHLNLEINKRQQKEHTYPSQESFTNLTENRQTHNIPFQTAQNQKFHKKIHTTNKKLNPNDAYMNIPDDPTRISQQAGSSKESDVVSYGLVAGLQLRKGSRDDLAICPTVPPRVRRHASVVLVRHNLIESNEASSSSAPLSLWSPKDSEKSPRSRELDAASFQNNPTNWKQTPGIDLDTVAASIKQQSTSSTPLARALKALHLRKSSEGKKATPEKSVETPVKKQQYL